MRLSTKGRYALRAVVELANVSKNGAPSVSLKEIASRQQISVKYLEALFTTLKNAGIVKSQRGAKGGYLLANHPSKISAMEIIEAIDGEICLVDCCLKKNVCKNSNNCPTVGLWRKINDMIIGELKSNTIQDLVENTDLKRYVGRRKRIERDGRQLAKRHVSGGKDE
ncbi:MAG: Rrf2 family transcriptional regulator [Deltaproteobacteria bacterium]|nr:Rrf2 family transcriptional regulator [Deltaproteobacteria bacterium]